MPTDLEIRGSVVPAAELSWRFSRSSGPGGQSVNTTDSRAEVSFDLAATSALPETLKARALRNLADRLVDGVITVAASEQRSQLMNRQAARRRLAEMLVEATAPPPPPRRPTRPSRGGEGASARREGSSQCRQAAAALAERGVDPRASAE